jgi:hypothetical protein
VDSNSLSQEERNEQTLLVKGRQSMLADGFRERMTTGQSFRRPNVYRHTFFKQVIDMATEVSFHNDIPTVRMTCFKFMRNSVQVAGKLSSILPGDTIGPFHPSQEYPSSAFASRIRDQF